MLLWKKQHFLLYCSIHNLCVCIDPILIILPFFSHFLYYVSGIVCTPNLLLQKSGRVLNCITIQWGTRWRSNSQLIYCDNCLLQEVTQSKAVSRHFCQKHKCVYKMLVFLGFFFLLVSLAIRGLVKFKITHHEYGESRQLFTRKTSMWALHKYFAASASPSFCQTSS